MPTQVVLTALSLVCGSVLAQPATNHSDSSDPRVAEVSGRAFDSGPERSITPALGPNRKGGAPAYESQRSTSDGGGGTASGGSFELTGSIAQPEAGARVATGGPFVLAGGFWADAAEGLFSDGFEGN